MLKKEFEINNGPYGHECAFEVFNSAEYDYLEVHSPLQNINPGKYSEYMVCWSMNRE